MKGNIRQLYEMLFSPIVTPYNLLENAKLDNYEYVNYSKSDEGLLVTMKCTIEKNFLAKFYYYFDSYDHLIKVIMNSDEGEEILFSREEEICKLKEKILREKSNPLSIPAV